MKYVSIIVLGFIVLITSCQEVIELELENNIPRLVINGMISDQVGPYQVQLTQTDDYFSEATPVGVGNAQIIIKDETNGVIDTLILVDSEKGLYETSSIQGIREHDYTIKINHENTIYESQTQMPSVTSIDTIVVRLVSGVSEDEDGYHIFMTVQEPADEENFYRIQTYENGTLIDDLDDLTIFSDEALEESIDDVDLGYVFEEGSEVRVELHSLTKEAFNYYTELIGAINNDGGLFSSPPTNPTNGFTNGMLGLFRASAIHAKTVLIE